MGHSWYTCHVPAKYHRIQITEDPELAAALRAAAPHMPSGIPRSKQVRDLAVEGARLVSAGLMDRGRRRALLEDLAASFDDPASADFDVELLRDGKTRAWPLR